MDVSTVCRRAREHAVVFTLADQGVLRVAGPDRQSWLNAMVTNDLSLLTPAGRIEACFLDVKGKIRALADVWEAGDMLRVVTARDRIAELVTSLERLIVMEDVTLSDESETLALLSVQGPKAAEVTAAAGLAGAPSDRTGSGGLDLLVAAAARDATVERLLAGGAVRGSDEALNLLRLEAALPRWGVDVTAELLPQEARVETSRVSFRKGCYLGQEPVVRLQSRGHANRLLTPLDLGEAEPPGAGAPVQRQGVEVGHVTSAGRGPTIGRTVALALLRRDAAAPGTTLEVDGRPAQVPDRPWVGLTTTGHGT